MAYPQTEKQCSARNSAGAIDSPCSALLGLINVLMGLITHANVHLATLYGIAAKALARRHEQQPFGSLHTVRWFAQLETGYFVDWSINSPRTAAATTITNTRQLRKKPPHTLPELINSLQIRMIRRHFVSRQLQTYNIAQQVIQRPGSKGMWRWEMVAHVIQTG